jgi:hypothetical protein
MGKTKTVRKNAKWGNKVLNDLKNLNLKNWTILSKTDKPSIN